jgi:hypothetical protein
MKMLLAFPFKHEDLTTALDFLKTLVLPASF